MPTCVCVVERRPRPILLMLLSFFSSSSHSLSHRNLYLLLFCGNKRYRPETLTLSQLAFQYFVKSDYLSKIRAIRNSSTTARPFCERHIGLPCSTCCEVRISQTDMGWREHSTARPARGVPRCTVLGTINKPCTTQTWFFPVRICKTIGVYSKFIVQVKRVLRVQIAETASNTNLKMADVNWTCMSGYWPRNSVRLPVAAP